MVAALSTIAALALFFTGTVPAMQEARHLQQVEVQRQQLHTMIWEELDAASTQRMALRIDIQSLMVELDRLGICTGPIVYEASPNPAADPQDLGARGMLPRDPR